MKLKAARLFVRDLQAARRFYVEDLGFFLVAEAARQGYFVLEAGGIQLVVEAVPPDAPYEAQDLVGRFTGLSFEVTDIEATYKSLASKGVFFSGRPEQQAWGAWLATFQDPQGNELQLVQVAGVAVPA